ncbi:amidophosphoribosyltransferase [Rickettsiales bacterium]|nr:amidophosphoribosyltransferase [Rickettsiales bacterium]
MTKDRIEEECGVFAIYNNKDAVINATLGLHALQHRGQESCGIVTSDEKEFYIHLANGLVSDNFNNQKIVDTLIGDMAIGHVRYSTAGKKNTRNHQPIFANFSFGDMAIAHNGNLTNAQILKKELIQKGSIFQSSMDSEVIIHLIALSKKQTIKDRIIDALSQIKGAFSLVIMLKDQIIAVRDIHGVRPLVLGQLGDSHIVASESCALDIIDVKLVRDVKKGEMIIIDKKGIHSQFPFTEAKSKFCIFEYIYFARPDSFIEGKNVYDVRKNIGIELAKEVQIDGDIIVPVPDSGVSAAIGYSNQSKIPFELGIIRNHYVGRTFIEPTDKIRHFGVKLKHNANRNLIEGKRVILIDDSIVRGTTSKKIVKMMRDAGAKEVYLLIASPPTTGSCFYGIDTPDKESLIANKLTKEQIAKEVQADLVEYISEDGLYRAIGEAKRNSDPQYCDACFTGDYPITLDDKIKNINE